MVKYVIFRGDMGLEVELVLQVGKILLIIK
jgi:hypothetical protein